MINKNITESHDENEIEMVDYKNITLPIGIAHAQGPIENFKITLYDRMGNIYKFQVTGGNICKCISEVMSQQLDYEVQ